ncbi:uncharacterized protein LOC143296229 [Babylonia areolata]|uniref:uncharacterized protein LOC143296229 n=1 Tax=Babylonia areolata TaxID=304850 RepID=UPI003FD28EB8
MSQGTEKQPLTEDPSSSSGSSSRRMNTDCCLGHIKTISRLVGLGVLAVLWAATVTTLRGDFNLPTYVGYYLLAASLLVTFFEITWILDKMACCVRQGCCCRCWDVILWVDGWRKFVLYTALSVPLFLQGLKGVFHVVCGFCLLVLACLYLVKSFASLRISTTTTTTTQRRTEQQATQETRHVSITVRHEISTQTDATSPSANKRGGTSPPPPPPPPPNPFDETEDEEDGGGKATGAEMEGGKSADAGSEGREKSVE